MKQKVIKKRASTLSVRKKGGIRICLLIGVGMISGVLFSCNNTNTDPNDTVNNAMNVNEQKAEDSALSIQTSDADFIVKAANGGVAEVVMAKVAQERATDEDVKTFAGKMIKDHSELNSQLKDLADSLNITLPAAIDESEQEDLGKLKSTATGDFDKTYIDMMVKAHNKDVKLFERAAKDILVPGIHHFIQHALPILKAHQEAIQFLAKSKAG